jgi:transketolase
MSLLSGTIHFRELMNDPSASASEMDDCAPLIHEARAIRLAVADALYAIPTGGHYGGCFSVVEILLGLYRLAMRIEPAEPENPRRDRLILSKGHSALTLYAVLRQLGYFSSDLRQYADFASRLEGHPDMLTLPGIDFSTGSLGQGLSVGAGMALALRKNATPVWVVLGDGECQEGQIWEAAMLASVYQLDNLCVVVDCNGFQECGWAFVDTTSSPEPVPEMAAKWTAFGWNVVSCNGHLFPQLARSFSLTKSFKGKPSVILAKTRKGKGAAYVEEQAPRFHCTSVSPAEHDIIIRQIQEQ